MKKVKIEITAYLNNDEDYDEIKRMEHHAEGITAEYPELQNIHVEVSEIKEN
jgi:hypothetical protein